MSLGLQIQRVSLLLSGRQPLLLHGEGVFRPDSEGAVDFPCFKDFHVVVVLIGDVWIIDFFSKRRALAVGRLMVVGPIGLTLDILDIAKLLTRLEHQFIIINRVQADQSNSSDLPNK